MKLPRYLQIQKFQLSWTPVSFHLPSFANTIKVKVHDCVISILDISTIESSRLIRHGNRVVFFLSLGYTTDTDKKSHQRVNGIRLISKFGNMMTPNMLRLADLFALGMFINQRN